MRSDERSATVSGRHLSDDQLMETYVLAGEHPHLTACRHCRARFDELVSALQQIREDAVHEADAIFSSQRLHDQRDRIMRRIERHGHPAEVVLFPTRAASHPAVQRVLGPARRWVAAAAAAGVAAGMFLGFVVDRGSRYAAMDRGLHHTQIAATVPAPIWRAAESMDDQFLTEIEDALRGRSLELRAIDTMTTPIEIREVSYPR